MSEDNETFAIVEIMGHQRIAGRISEVVRFGVPFMQVDVPEVDGRPGFSRRYAGGAIFSETAVSKELVLAWLRREGDFIGNPIKQLAAPVETPPDAEEVGPAEGCEGCGARATHRDSDNTPLCKGCYDELPTIQRGATTDDEAIEDDDDGLESLG